MTSLEITYSSTRATECITTIDIDEILLTNHVSRLRSCSSGYNASRQIKRLTTDYTPFLTLCYTSKHQLTCLCTNRCGIEIGITGTPHGEEGEEKSKD